MNVSKEIAANLIPGRGLNHSGAIPEKTIPMGFFSPPPLLLRPSSSSHAPSPSPFFLLLLTPFGPLFSGFLGPLPFLMPENSSRWGLIYGTVLTVDKCVLCLLRPPKGPAS